MFTKKFDSMLQTKPPSSSLNLPWLSQLRSMITTLSFPPPIPSPHMRKPDLVVQSTRKPKLFMDMSGLSQDQKPSIKKMKTKRKRKISVFQHPQVVGRF